MIQKDLFEKILLEPLESGCDSLLIVSGYASATMASRHFEKIDKLRKRVHVDVIVGMPLLDGVLHANHDLFKDLVSDRYPTLFGCRYVTEGKPVHSKIYVWLKDKEPVCAFNGSANYTQGAFFERQHEAMSLCDPDVAYLAYKALLKKSTDCRDERIEEKIQIVEEESRILQILRPEIATSVPISELHALPKVTISLLASDGSMHKGGGGLNWGIRQARNFRPEAYIGLPPEVYKSDFFPERGAHFTVLADDGWRTICSRGQKSYANSLQTPLSNQDFGLYFRKRLGNLPEHELISKDDLLSYGRTSVDFYKVDDDTYIMDFAKP